MPAPNRVALYIGGAAAFLAALAPVVVDMDWTSTAGVISAVLALTGLIWKFLSGWQQYEHDQALGAPLLMVDDFDEAEAELTPEAIKAAHADVPDGN